jgi:hypothetical protein
MTFVFEGVRYRIVFRHDLSRRLEDHTAHYVYLRPILGERYRGPAYLMCQTCTQKHKLAVPLKLTGLTKAEKRRNTACVILEEIGPANWRPTEFSGVSQLNIDEGDQFSRELGRYHALLDALSPRMKASGGALCDPKHAGSRRFYRATKEFRDAAWAAYYSRSQKGVGR